jgi:hypothetical protein
MPANPNSNTTYTLSTSDYATITLTPSSGSATTATVKTILPYATRPTDANVGITGKGGIRKYIAASTMTTNKPSFFGTTRDSHIIHLDWDTDGGYDSQLAISINNNNANSIAVRTMVSKTWGNWYGIYSEWDEPSVQRFGTCSTAAATAAKEVTVPGNFILKTGSVVYVKFTVANTAAVGSLTLNVNNTGAKNIKYISQSNLPGTGYLRANQTIMFIYDGTYWIYMSNIQYDTNTDTKVRQTNSTTNADYRVLLSYAATNDQQDNIAYKSSALTFNPSTKVLQLDGWNISKNSTTNALEFSIA